MIDRRLLVLLAIGACKHGGGSDAPPAAGDAPAASADAPGAPDAAPPDGPTAACTTCSPDIGRCAPLAVCSPADPCTDLLGRSVTTEIDLPSCTTTAADHPAFDDGPPLQWSDAVSGDLRAACRYVPPSASAAAPVPLLVFMHGSHGSADDVYNHTLLRAKAVDSRFALISLEGRNLHWEGPNPDGSHFDYLHRDLGAPSANPDVRALDHVIDELVATGVVDPQRIAVAGWSNGAFMAELYAVARHDRATPGGSRVAAALAYAGADPFTTWDASLPECALAPYPTSSVPILFVHRSCDSIVTCSSVEDWFTRAASSAADGMGDRLIADLIIDSDGAMVDACDPSCGAVAGGLNHVRWPDGIADKSGLDWEPTMLLYLQNHPLP